MVEKRPLEPHPLVAQLFDEHGWFFTEDEDDLTNEGDTQ